MSRHVLTLISPPTHAVLRANSFLIARLRASLNPVRMVWLSPCACDFEFDRPPVGLALLQPLFSEHSLDVVLQPMEGREKQLLISDMDSTMIAQECIDELADAVGQKAHVSAITERAMRGELDFAEALTARVALLAGLPIEALEETYRSRITLMPGAQTLVRTMRARGAKTLLVSGGFTFFTSRVATAIGFDGQEANTLEIVDEKLTGRVAMPILDKISKKRSLLRAAQQHHVPLARTLAVGDGANDLPMIIAAGLGVAYHAKPLVEQSAPASIRFNDLSALLYIQGIRQAEWAH